MSRDPAVKLQLANLLCDGMKGLWNTHANDNSKGMERQKIFQSSQTINSENFRTDDGIQRFFFLFSLMVSSISTSRIMDCYFNYRITSFSIFLSQFNCALDISLSYRECDICQQFVPRPKLFIKRVITFASASKCFQVKKRTFVIFLIVFLFLMVSGLWFVILHVMIWIYLVWHGIFLRFQRFSDFAKSIIWVVDSARSTWRQTVGKMGSTWCKTSLLCPEIWLWYISGHNSEVLHQELPGKTHDLIRLSILHLYCGLKASYPEVQFGSLAWSPR